MSPGDGAMCLRAPRRADGCAVHALVAECPPLDLNSIYAYLLLSEHFAQSCVLAEDAQGRLNGFISAYVPPAKPDVLFVWQVAVRACARGRGLGRLMLHHILERPGLAAVRAIEATVSPGNAASRRMFESFAGQLRAPVRDCPLFERQLFGADGHADERLLHIGPVGAMRA